MEMAKGTALLIFGEAESCRQAARQIAATHGTYVEVTADQLMGAFALDNVIRASAGTVICEGIPDKKVMTRLKDVIGSTSIVVNSKFQPPQRKPTPNFIFWSGERPMLDEGDRRFIVIDARCV